MFLESVLRFGRSKCHFFALENRHFWNLFAPLVKRHKPNSEKKCFLGHPSIHVAKRPCSGDDDDHNDATDIQNIPGWPPFTVPTTLHLTLF